jgi:hypothetical protein
MAQNRPAPAYQEYAASMLANVKFRLMGIPERGLLYTMRLECWVNGQVPSDPSQLAKVLGLDSQAVKECLPAMKAFFDERDGMLFSPELDDYRKHLEDARQKKIEGGKKGAAISHRQRKEPKSVAHDAMGNPEVTHWVTHGSLVQSSSGQSSQEHSSQKQSSGRELSEHDEWLNDYESASNGFD